jgi:uncharacterized protein YyaL (SSP411 family)
MLIDAHLTASDRLGDLRACGCALRAVETLLSTHRDDTGVFAHFVQDGSLQSVGLLSDQAWMGKALTHAYVVSGRPQYLRAARQVGDYLLGHLVADDGAFVSTSPAGAARADRPAPVRSWEDSPVRSVGSVAAEFLTDLGLLAGEARYVWAARRALESLAGAVGPDMGLFLAGYASAVEHLLAGPVSLAVVAEVDPRRCQPLAGFKSYPPSGTASAQQHQLAQELGLMATRHYVPHTLVFLLDPRRDDDCSLLEALGYQQTAEPTAYVCQGAQCMEPARSVEDLRERMERIKRAG